MAFFKLFKKKKKEAPHKQLTGASPPSPEATPPPPPPPPAVVVDQSATNLTVREESLYLQTSTDPQRGTTTITERVPSPQNAASIPANLREFEANQAAIDLTRSLVKRFIADIWNRGEVDLIPEVCSSSLRFNGNTGFDRVGHEGLARMVNTIREALDDYHCEIHSMVVEHNKAFCRLRFTGKYYLTLLYRDKGIRRVFFLDWSSHHETLAWVIPTQASILEIC